jgi:hypothetical protein
MDGEGGKKKRWKKDKENKKTLRKMTPLGEKVMVMNHVAWLNPTSCPFSLPIQITCI